jgi:hypothetical protein
MFFKVRNKVKYFLCSLARKQHDSVVKKNNFFIDISRRRFLLRREIHCIRRMMAYLHTVHHLHTLGPAKYVRGGNATCTRVDDRGTQKRPEHILSCQQRILLIQNDRKIGKSRFSTKTSRCVGPRHNSQLSANKFSVKRNLVVFLRIYRQKVEIRGERGECRSSFIAL